jgi:hypothetical protein
MVVSVLPIAIVLYLLLGLSCSPDCTTTSLTPSRERHLPRYLEVVRGYLEEVANCNFRRSHNGHFHANHIDVAPRLVLITAFILEPLFSIPLVVPVDD